jgi:hypothetical protein
VTHAALCLALLVERYAGPAPKPPPPRDPPEVLAARQRALVEAMRPGGVR